MRDIGLHIAQPPTLFCDNISALHISINPVFYAKIEHIEIDYHFVREKVALGSLITKFVSSSQQVANIFTKPLAHRKFKQLRVKLVLWPSPRPSLRGSVEDHKKDDSHCILTVDQKG